MFSVISCNTFLNLLRTINEKQKQNGPEKEIISENVSPVRDKRCSLPIKSENDTHWKKKKSPEISGKLTLSLPN
jgi:hypothetical protein